MLAEFLLAMSKRGPTVPEITGAARSMRANMHSIDAPPDAIDLCGTGGDGHNTLNISTAVSFVVAGCGVPVAKHGNRSATSRAGAADTLEALGVKIDLSQAAAERCLREAGLVFPVRARLSSGNAPRRAGAQEARHPHDLQSAWSPLESRAREAAIARRLCA